MQKKSGSFGLPDLNSASKKQDQNVKEFVSAQVRDSGIR